MGIQPRGFDGNTHGVFEAVGEDDDLVGSVVAVGILHHQDAVAGVAFGAGRWEVSVAFDGPDAARMIDVDAGRRDNIGMLGEQLDFNRESMARGNSSAANVACVQLIMDMIAMRVRAVAVGMRGIPVDPLWSSHPARRVGFVRQLVRVQVRITVQRSLSRGRNLVILQSDVHDRQ